MKPFQLISIVFFGTALLSLAGEKPNIIVILADDLGYGDVKAFNPSAGTQTPCLDKLAADGLCFTDGHACSSLCSPSRYGLLTEHYAWHIPRLRWGVLGEADAVSIETNCDTLASMLKRNGYYTAIIGKWHLGLGGKGTGDQKFATAREGLMPGPNQVGFDYSNIMPASIDMGLHPPTDRAITLEA